jgi:F420-dependent oxidoreductase-like protein
MSPSTTPWFGLHAGLQRTTTAELTSLWQRAEAAGLDWVSIWDHFYAADGTGDPESLEAVACHTALALSTSRVRCGSLVYSAGFRHPAVLANAIATIDQLSGGRVTLGLGGGWLVDEYRAYGFPFGSAGERLGLLREYVQVVRSLLREPRTTHAGEHFTLTDAACEPKPVQADLPIWIGGGGEKVTLRIAAELADGWNIPYVSAETWAHKSQVLDGHCEAVGRDPAQVTRTVNVGIVRDEDDLQAQFGAIADFVRPGVLVGTGAESVEKLAAFVEAGAEGLIFVLRAPFDADLLDEVCEAVVPALRG